MGAPVVVLGHKDLLARLQTAQKELEALAPAPRVELDRAAVLAMIAACIQALTAH